MKANIIHLLNCSSFAGNHELRKAQEISFHSIENALRYSLVKPEIHAALLPEDAAMQLPEFFNARHVLDRSYNGSRKLPYLKDILHSVSSTNSLIIYSNIDIVIQPYFYDAVQAIYQDGTDGFIINRRRISKNFLKDNRMELMYASQGGYHQGFDCFVFHSDLIRDFVTNDVVIGIPHFCNTLAHNIFTRCKNPLVFADAHLTFHVGCELVKKWGNNADYRHNKNEFLKNITELRKDMDISKFPYAPEFVLKRYFKWVMNPQFSGPFMIKLDLSQFRRKRKRPVRFTDWEKDRPYYEFLQRILRLR